MEDDIEDRINAEETKVDGLVASLQRIETLLLSGAIPNATNRPTVASD